MRTQKMIILIVMTIILVGFAAAAGVVWWLGFGRGMPIVIGAVALAILVFMTILRPWYRRWGATDQEVAMAMPGDDLFRDAGSVTRAIGIAAQPMDVWPWLVQLGFGRAGWYSYDWIDNDGRPSADEVIPEYQTLEPGDRILMMPDMGFVVTSVEPGHSIVSTLDNKTTSWSLGLYPDKDGTRLVSRWRNTWGKVTPATAFFVALTDPGTFIMEQKMLREIRNRAERTASLGSI